MSLQINSLHYAEKDCTVWRETIKNIEFLFKNYGSYIYKPYLEGFRRLGLHTEQPPSIEFLTAALSSTGWKPVLVNEHLSAQAYISLVAKKNIPVNSRIRELKHLHYAPAPDFIHDVIGHLPLLFFADYVEYLMDLCECFLLTDPDIPDARNNLGKLFLWTIEFGLMKEDSRPKIYGAGLMSSSLEAIAVCKGDIEILPFANTAILKEFHYSELQDQVFVANSFQFLRNNLCDYKKTWMQNAL